MKALLGRAQRSLLHRFANARVLMAFDFDGTLAPIVAERDRAGMRATTERLFVRLCELYPCAVISGRARADLRGRVTSAKVKYLVGNHGLEPSPFLKEARRLTTAAKRALAPEAQRWAGVDVEDKRYSLALHYRQAAHKESTRRALLAAVERVPLPLRVVHGKMVLNVVPAEAPDKGQALLALKTRQRAEIVFYLGDDFTDEDVFRMRQPHAFVTARVGRSRSSAAEFYLPDQKNVDDLLALLVRVGEGHSP